MCLAVPGRVEKIFDDNHALVDFDGVKKRVCIDLITGVQVGDYVNVHVGFAINKIDKKQALETLQIIKEVTETT